MEIGVDLMLFCKDCLKVSKICIICIVIGPIGNY